MEDPQRSPAQALLDLVHAQEAEVARIARVLHDEVSQVLSAVGLQLDVLRMDYQASAPELAARTAEIQQMLEVAINQVRDLSHDLNPSIVERAGLQFALSRLVGRCRKPGEAPIRLLYDSTVRLPQPAAKAMYQIAEHALDNAVRHAPGALIEVIVKHSRDGAALEVRDEGEGFNVAEMRQHGGLGLMLMEYDAEQAGLEFSVSSSPGAGTIVKATCRTAEAP